MSDKDYTLAVPEPSIENEGKVQYLLIVLADREYGIRLDTLQEVLRYNASAVAPVPNTPDWLQGIFSLRGQIVSVVNLRLFLGLLTPPAKPKPLSGIGIIMPRLLILHSGELWVGVIVEDIHGVLFVDPDTIQHGTEVSYLEGAYQESADPDNVVWLFDTNRLLNSAEMLAFEPLPL